MIFLRLLSAAFLLLGIIPAQADNPSEKTIKIGLLIPDNKSTAAKNGAELAIINANREGGFSGIPFQLSVRSMEGPWGTGSKEAVSLIFEEKVCAILGSHDGRNAHLVEQVTTKARIVFLSAWSGDPTLAQAFVPWYFSCVPTDLQQADAFVEEICNKMKLSRIVAVSDNGYDSKLAMESFAKRLKSVMNLSAVQLTYEDQNPDFDLLITSISNASPDAIILFGKPHASLELAQLLREKAMIQPIFGGLSLQNENESLEQDLTKFRNIFLIAPGSLMTSKNKAFREEYRKVYGKYPGAVASYAFDGMNLLITAIRKEGTGRENIQKALAGMHYKGVTGTIGFDDKGKRLGIPVVTQIKNDFHAKP